MIELDKKVV